MALSATAAVLLGACADQAVAYNSADDLAAALVAADVECGGVHGLPPADHVKSRASCGSGGGRLDLFVFTDAQQRDTWLRVGARLRPVAVGPNWAVTGETRAIAGAAGALRGRIAGRP